MELSGFYKVRVKIEYLQESGKTKTVKENYIVTNCGDPQHAVTAVEKHLHDLTAEWAIDSVKEEKISDVIDA